MAPYLGFTGSWTEPRAVESSSSTPQPDKKRESPNTFKVSLKHMKGLAVIYP
jgi:hypothetical protein